MQNNEQREGQVKRQPSEASVVTAGSRRRARIVVGAACAALVALACAGPAAAKIVNLRVYNGGVFPEGSFNGAGSVGGTAPFPNNLQQIGINQETDQVFVSNSTSNRVYKFNAAGEPEEFSALAGATTLAPPSINNFGDLMVDNSGGSGGGGEGEQGRIYVFPESGPVRAFKPSGEEILGNFPLSVGGACAGEVVPGPSGNFWIAQWNSDKIIEFNSAGVATGKELTPTNNPCGLAIDSNGNFYVVEESSGVVHKFNSALEPQGVFDGETGFSETEVAVDRSNDHVYVDHRGTFANKTHVNEFESSGALIGQFGFAEPVKEYLGLETSRGLAVRESNHLVYAGNNRNQLGSRWVDTFVQLPPTTIPDVTTGEPSVTPTTATLVGTVDQDVGNGGSKIEYCKFEWGSTNQYGEFAECEPAPPIEGTQAVEATIEGLTKGATYHVRLTAYSENEIPSHGADVAFQPSGPPGVTEDIVSEVNTDSVKLSANIDPNGGDSSYHFEFGPTTAYGTVLPEPDGEVLAGLAETVSVQLPGLSAGATYHFRVVSENFAGTTVGADHKFSTFPLNPNEPDLCANAQVRQQTGASLLLDCRAYELTSAGNTGGYDVQSNLIPGQETLKPEPGAADRVLYSVHFGAIPNTGDPTNFGLDPYVATRGGNGWSTDYVGIDAGGPPANPEPFGSPLADSNSSLGTFAFGGEHLCDPCFEDGTSGIPVRLPNGSLVQGMRGSLNPGPSAEPSGEVRKALSADGSHLIFGSTSQFEPAGNNGSLTIYDRNLNAGTTQVASTMPNGLAMTGEVAELDVSADGSRIVFGKPVSTDGAGNTYYELYMHIGTNAGSYQVSPGAFSGVLYAGMSDDGSKVFFTTTDKLLGGDTDTSADLYKAEVSAGGSVTLSQVTTSNNDGCNPVEGKEGPHWNTVSGAANCDVVGLAGGAGVASEDGSVFFLSPEKLDGSGVADEANLFIARPGGGAHFVATVEPIAEMVTNAVFDNAVHRFSDFQVTTTGDDAVFSSTRSLTGFPNLGHSEIFRYDAPTDTLTCVSCAATGAGATGDSSLAQGLNIAESGAVFFTSTEPLVLRDTNQKRDVYEWEKGKQQLISTGLSDFDSGLLSVSANGVNAYFYTRAKLVPQDENGNLLKIYDARANGGFLAFAPPPLCAASDECHGAGTQAAPPPQIGTYEGSGGNVTQGTDRCAGLSRRAKQSSNRAKQLRRKASKSANGEQARRLRRKASKSAKKARKLNGQAKACRRSSGGTG
jgi:hypothetical protein